MIIIIFHCFEPIVFSEFIIWDVQSKKGFKPRLSPLFASLFFSLHLLSTTRRQLNKLFMPIDSAQCFCSALCTKLLTLFSFHKKINDKWNATQQQKQKEKCTDNQSGLFFHLEVMNLRTELLFIVEESALNCSVQPRRHR